MLTFYLCFFLFLNDLLIMSMYGFYMLCYVLVILFLYFFGMEYLFVVIVYYVWYGTVEYLLSPYGHLRRVDIGFNDIFI